MLFHTQAINNAGRYSNPTADQMLEAARIDQDAARRTQTYQQVDALLLQDAAALPLWYSRSYVLVKPYVQGFSQNSQGVPDFFSVWLVRQV